MLESLNHSQKIKAIILLKGSLLFGLLLYSYTYLEFGEKQALSKGEGSESSNSDSASTGQNKVVTDESDPVELVAKSAINDEDYSVLEGLLEVPALKSDSKEQIGRYLTLAERAKQQVNDRIKLLEKRAKYLTGLQDSLEDKISKFEKEKKFFLNTIQKEKEIQKDRLDTIVALYEKMEPKRAGPMLEQMDKDLVVALIKQLKQKQVTAILEAMAPEKSVEITEYFGRVGSAREYEILRELNKSLQDEFEKCKDL